MSAGRAWRAPGVAVLACAGAVLSAPAAERARQPGFESRPTAVVSAQQESRARHHRLEVRHLVFRPPTVRVAPGDTVSWINRDIVPHTVTGAGIGGQAGPEAGVESGLAPRSGAVPRAGSGPDWDSGLIGTGRTFTLVVSERPGPDGQRITLVAEPGDTIRYRCRYHPTMTATLVVRPHREDDRARVPHGARAREGRR